MKLIKVLRNTLFMVAVMSQPVLNAQYPGFIAEEQSRLERLIDKLYRLQVGVLDGSSTQDPFKILGGSSTQDLFLTLHLLERGSLDDSVFPARDMLFKARDVPVKKGMFLKAIEIFGFSRQDRWEDSSACWQNVGERYESLTSDSTLLVHTRVRYEVTLALVGKLLFVDKIMGYLDLPDVHSPFEREVISDYLGLGMLEREERCFSFE